jgi:hypothetical protein
MFWAGRDVETTYQRNEVTCLQLQRLHVQEIGFTNCSVPGLAPYYMFRNWSFCKFVNISNAQKESAISRIPAVNAFVKSE